MKQRDAYELISKELRRLGRPDDDPMTGFTFKLAEPYKDRWDELPP